MGKDVLTVLKVGAAVGAILLACEESHSETVESKVYQSAIQHHIEPQLALAILHAESKLNVGAINHVTHDYGIGQINIHTIKHYNFSTKKLLTNEDYSIDSSMTVLYDIKKQYARREPLTWFCRYNVGSGTLIGNRSRNCAKYTKRVTTSTKIVQARGTIAYEIFGN